MRGLKRNPWLFGLGVLLAIPVVYGGHARADVTTDQSGSIVIFPKVIADGTRDTLIQITNTSNMPAQAQCFYIDASGSCSVSNTACLRDTDCPGQETCVPSCQEVNFEIFLTAQQPTQWRVSTGRFAPFPLASPCKVGQPCTCTVDTVSGALKCPGFDPIVGAGLNALAVKPTGSAFVGELKCIQTTSDLVPVPVGQDSLKGEAVIEDLASGQVSEYNAIAITSLPGLNSNNDLKLLDGPAGQSGLNEYSSCPASLVIDHYADGATDAFTGATVSTEVTVVPCTELLEEQIPTHSIVSFVVFNELEQRFSADGVNFDCLFSRRLSDIPTKGADVFTEGNMGTRFAKLRITPSSSQLCLTGSNRGFPCSTNNDCPGFQTTPDGTQLGCTAAPSVLAVAEEFHSITGRPDGTAAFNASLEAPVSQPPRFDIMVLPPSP